MEADWYQRIYERLYERLQIGQYALGEMESIFGDRIREMEKQLLDPELSDRQKEEVIDQTAQALENLKREEDELEGEAGSLVRHGDYIIDSIMESRDKHRWLDDKDILIYVRDGLQRHFPGSIIEVSPPGSDTYRIRLSRDGMAAFQTYLSRHGLRGRTRLLNGDGRQRYRFTRSVVGESGRIENISQLHPLVRFAAERDLDDDDVRNSRSVAARIDLEMLPERCVPGCYVLAARRWSSSNSGSGNMASVRIGYAGAYVATGEPMDSDLAERVMVAAAEHGRPILNAAMHRGLGDASGILRDVVRPELDRRFGDFIDRISAENEDRVAIQRRSLVRHFERKIATLREQKINLSAQMVGVQTSGNARKAASLRNLAAAYEARIRKLQETWRLREAEMEEQLSVVQEESDVSCLFLQVDGPNPAERVGR